jgi:cytoskeletal protein CcmA (bactofilin family)
MMWKPATPSDKPQIPAAPAPSPANLSPEKKETRPMEINRLDRTDVAHIGKSVVIKGELSGSEDLHVDGEVEGNIDLKEHVLTIGPHGRVRANVQAREIVVHGKVDGNLNGTDRVELKRSAVQVGDISTQRIVIEDGAFFKGAIDIRKDAKPAARAAEPAKAYNSSASAASTGTTASPSQPGLIPQS